MSLRKVLSVMFAIVFLLTLLPAIAVAQEPATENPVAQGEKDRAAAYCALLEDARVTRWMSAALELKLKVKCGLVSPKEAHLVAPMTAAPWQVAVPAQGSDVRITAPETGLVDNTTQSETSIVVNGSNVCAAYNDEGAYPAFDSFSGYSYSNDGGDTWFDGGYIPPGPSDGTWGDPSITYRAADDRFYYASLSDAGLSLWRSSDQCQTFAYVGPIHSGTGDDKELMAIDNTGGVYNGRMYVFWTDFNVGDIYSTFSTDAGTTWSTPVQVSSSAFNVQGAWPTVAPNGDLYVAWLQDRSSGNISEQIARSTDGGVSFTILTPIVIDVPNPGHTAYCPSSGTRDVVNGDVRYLPSPQIAIGLDGRIHATYSYGGVAPDEIDVYYRYSDDQGATWGPEHKLNDDATTTDQFFPTMAVNSSNAVVASWYDRRNDPVDNLVFERWEAVSRDGGNTWESNTLVSDAPSQVPPINPNFSPYVHDCYMGDYDWTTMDDLAIYQVWSDSRVIITTPGYPAGRPDPDVWFEKEVLGIGSGALHGTITEAAPLDAPGDPLPDVTVTAQRMGGGGKQTMTDATGYYTVTLVSGTYTVTAEGPQHGPATVSGVEIITGAVTLQDFALDPKGLLQGVVTDADTGAPLAATITISPTDDVLFTAPATGYYSMYLPAGNYDVMAAATDYASQTVPVNITMGGTTQQDFALLAAVSVVPDPIVITLELGQTGTVGSVMTNNMAVDYPFQFVEAPQMGKALRAGEDVLVVRHETTMADAMQTALTNLGYTYLGVTDTEFQAMTVDDLLGYLAVFHAGTTGTSGAPSDSEILLLAYLDAGGSLYISDNDLGYYRHGNAFYDTYLQATWLSDDPGINTLIGESFMAGLTLDVSADLFPDDFTVSAQGTRIFRFDGGNAAGVAVDRNGYRAIYTSFDFDDIASAANETAVIDRVLGFLVVADVPWYGTSLVDGTVLAGDSLGWTNYFTATPAVGVDQPGDYGALLRIKPVAGLRADLPTKEIPVILSVLPTTTMGKLDGTVTSDRPGGALEADILVEAAGGVTYTITSDPSSGYYSYWLDAGTYTVTASAAGYVSETVVVDVTAGVTTPQDFELALLAPEIAVTPLSMEETLDFGAMAVQTLTISNDGLLPLNFEIKERGGDFIPILAGARAGEDVLVVRHDTTMADAMQTALTNLGYTYLGVTDAEFQAMTVDDLLGYLAVFHAGTTGTSGAPSASETLLVAYLDAGGSLYISDNDLGYWRNGSLFYDTYLQATWLSDDPGINTLIGEDLMTGLTLDVSADPYPDDFTVSAEGTRIFRFDGGNAAGVAVDRSGYRAIYTSFDFDDIASAGDETAVIDRGMAYLGAIDVPWLMEDPISGTVATGNAVDVQVTFDAGTVAEPGIYLADLHVSHDDPLAAKVTVPVTLTVLPSADMGKLEGTVSGTGYCDGDSYPLDAEVVIESSTGTTWTVSTDPATGYYFRWLLAGTYDVTASAADHRAAMASVQVTAAQTVTQDLDLRLIESCMDLTPLKFAVNMLPDSQLTDTLSIINNGAGDLPWEIRETTATMRLVNEDVLVKVPAIAARSGVASRSEFTGSAARSISVHVGWVKADVIDVLLVTPDVVGGGDITLLLNTLAAFPDLNVVVWDGNAGAPSVVDMQAYDVVFVGNDVKWTSSAIDKITLSNNLADYIDAGGKVLAGSFIWSYDEWGMSGGRFMTEDYSPFEMATVDIWDPTTLGTFNAGHPIMAGITSVTDNFNHQDPALSSTGALVASWADGQNFVAVSPNCVGLNQEYFHNADFGGQTAELLHNALVYLPGAPAGWVDVPWVSEVPTNSVTLADNTYDVDVTFDSTGLTVGECYTASLGLLHDDPGWTVPMMIPLQLCVTCTQVTDVALSVVTVGDIHPGDVVEFSASMTPHEMTMPFSYSIDMGDGSSLIVGSSSDDPMVFTHTFALADAYTVTLSISNCGMTEPVARSLNVVVTEPMHYLYLPLISKNATP